MPICRDPLGCYDTVQHPFAAACGTSELLGSFFLAAEPLGLGLGSASTSALASATKDGGFSAATFFSGAPSVPELAVGGRNAVTSATTVSGGGTPACASSATTTASSCLRASTKLPTGTPRSVLTANIRCTTAASRCSSAMLARSGKECGGRHGAPKLPRRAGWSGCGLRGPIEGITCALARQLRGKGERVCGPNYSGAHARAMLTGASFDGDEVAVNGANGVGRQDVPQTAEKWQGWCFHRHMPAFWEWLAVLSRASLRRPVRPCHVIRRRLDRPSRIRHRDAIQSSALPG